jgi:hypothetical protein
MGRSINDLAADLNMTPKNVRKHWRAYVRANGGTIGQDTPGKGKRYDLDARTYAAFKKQVGARASKEAASKSTTSKSKGKSTPRTRKPKAASVAAAESVASVTPAVMAGNAHEGSGQHA